MTAYRPPTYRPVRVARQISGARLGAIPNMNVGDWLLLVGGAIVGGAGANAILAQFQERVPNVISLLLGGVIAGVGLTLFVQKVQKLAA